MKCAIPLIGLFLTGAAAAFAQPATTTVINHNIPSIEAHSQSVSLQSSLYSNLYRSASAVDDMSWVAQNDSALRQFIGQYGDSVLDALSDLSGIEWRETALDLFVVRYFPSPGSADPLILPLGGVRVGTLSEAIPGVAVQRLCVIYQLSHRMLLQGLDPAAPTYVLLSRHPLMQAASLRRDNLAILLALAVSQRVIGSDSTYEAFQSPFWRRYLEGWDIFQQYLYRKWNLSKERPLTRWLAEEPEDSKLIEITEPLADQSIMMPTGRRSVIEGVSPTGRFGFSLRSGSGNVMVVDKIDSARTAYRCGLRSGDIIKSVDSRRPKNQKELIELILDQMEGGGAMLGVTRSGKNEAVFIRPSVIRGQ